MFRATNVTFPQTLEKIKTKQKKDFRRNNVSKKKTQTKKGRLNVFYSQPRIPLDTNEI